MNPITTPQFLPETLSALSNLVTLWNTDPISQNSSLIITGNQISIINEENSNASFQFSNEAIQLQNNPGKNIETPQGTDALESLLTTIDVEYTIKDLDRNLILFEPIEENTIIEATLTPDPEQNITPSIENDLSTQIKEDSLADILRDLTEESNRPLVRVTPLLATTWKAQVEEIISRIQKGTCGQDRKKQIQTLEACYYL